MLCVSLVDIGWTLRYIVGFLDYLQHFCVGTWPIRHALAAKGPTKYKTTNLDQR